LKRPEVIDEDPVPLVLLQIAQVYRARAGKYFGSTSWLASTS